jgi:hypothetical protein
VIWIAERLPIASGGVEVWGGTTKDRATRIGAHRGYGDPDAERQGALRYGKLAVLDRRTGFTAR